MLGSTRIVIASSPLFALFGIEELLEFGEWRHYSPKFMSLRTARPQQLKVQNVYESPTPKIITDYKCF